MGEVYRARDSRLDRDVAIKILPASVADDADRLRRFEHEARAIASLNHPHVCQLYNIGPGYLVLDTSTASHCAVQSQHQKRSARRSRSRARWRRLTIAAYCTAT